MPGLSNGDIIGIVAITSGAIFGFLFLRFQIMENRSQKNTEKMELSTRELKASLSELQRCLNSYGVDTKEVRLQLENVKEEMINTSRVTKIPMNMSFIGKLRRAVSNDKQPLTKCLALLKKEKKSILDYYAQ